MTFPFDFSIYFRLRALLQAQRWMITMKRLQDQIEHTPRTPYARLCFPARLHLKSTHRACNYSESAVSRSYRKLLYHSRQQRGSSIPSGRRNVGARSANCAAESGKLMEHSRKSGTQRVLGAKCAQVLKPQTSRFESGIISRSARGNDSTLALQLLTSVLRELSRANSRI